MNHGLLITIIKFKSLCFIVNYAFIILSFSKVTSEYFMVSFVNLVSLSVSLFQILHLLLLNIQQLTYHFLQVVERADPHVGLLHRGTEKLIEYKTYLQVQNDCIFCYSVLH